MTAQDFFANSVTITPVFAPTSAVTSLPDTPVKLEFGVQNSTSLLSCSGEFEDFSAWVKCEFCDYRCPKKGMLFVYTENCDVCNHLIW